MSFVSNKKMGLCLYINTGLISDTFLAIICRTNSAAQFFVVVDVYLSIRPPPEFLPVLGTLEQYMTLTIGAALLCSPRVGSDLGRKSDWLRSFIVTI